MNKQKVAFDPELITCILAFFFRTQNQDTPQTRTHHRQVASGPTAGRCRTWQDSIQRELFYQARKIPSTLQSIQDRSSEPRVSKMYRGTKSHLNRWQERHPSEGTVICISYAGHIASIVWLLNNGRTHYYPCKGFSCEPCREINKTPKPLVGFWLLKSEPEIGTFCKLS